MADFEKHTWDRRTYTVDCSALLDAGDSITAVTGVTADQGGLTFGTASINSGVVTLPDGSTVAAGRAVQFRIDDGQISGPNTYLDCLVRIRLVTTLCPRLEATVVLRLNDESLS